MSHHHINFCAMCFCNLYNELGKTLAVGLPYTIELKGRNPSEATLAALFSELLPDLWRESMTSCYTWQCVGMWQGISEGTWCPKREESPLCAHKAARWHSLCPQSPPGEGSRLGQ